MDRSGLEAQGLSWWGHSWLCWQGAGMGRNGADSQQPWAWVPMGSPGMGLPCQLLLCVQPRLASSYLLSFLFFFFFLLFFPFLSFLLSFLAAPSPRETLGQGSDPSFSRDLSRSLQQCRIPNPLCWTRHQTRVPWLPKRLQSHCTTAGAPVSPFLVPILGSSLGTL